MEKEKKIWLHRISYHKEVSYPLLDIGYLSIGFSDLAEPDFIEKVRGKNGQKEFEARTKEWGRGRWGLWRFVVEMKKGDWVVVPNYPNYTESGYFSIFELLDDEPLCLSDDEFSKVFSEIKDWNGNKLVKGDDEYFYRENTEEVIDLGFIREVKLIEKDIPKNKYADADLTSKMKILNTNIDITDIKKSVEEALNSFKKNKPINIYSEIVDKTSEEILDIIRSKLNPNKFEKLVEWYFNRIDASEVNIPSKNENDKEGDVDVIASFDHLKTIICVQVKFHKGETDSTGVKQIGDYIKEIKENTDDEYSRIGWVISSADKFSDDAIKSAKEVGIHLINGKQFVEMILKVGIDGIERI